MKIIKITYSVLYVIDFEEFLIASENCNKCHESVKSK